ncbi:HEAT repeat domain-containing protein [Desulfobulbus alkaliphilus]|uniref:HEAT repeat domain-containing protein n=1 Tax=Desulfobulbus alkaliphilus TaxID=869814 RepID=UPI0019639230|nr:HEAT repeat domain-containing protein [Desulfobulbus alkaliphilus]MBM9536965.1 HEAT repeat domain-containing protein [Desulfobulbus alkaliphilus]
MATSRQTPSPDRSTLLLDFPMRIYTALRTMRLYPAANPQVQRSNDFVLKAFTALMADKNDDAVNLALSDKKILVCGDPLADRDQERPQIQGLITLLDRLKIHSFTFHSGFDFDQCALFIESLANLLGERDLSEPLADLFNRAGLHAVSVDAKRYVAVHKGEQVVREEMIGAGLNISDEELANYVLGKSGPNGQARAIAPELIEELLSRLPKSAEDQGQSHILNETVLELLEKLSREIDFGKRSEGINQSATALTRLDPALLAGLVAKMPATAVADEVLDSTLDRLSPNQRNTLIANLVARLPSGTTTGSRDQQRQTGIDILERLAGLQAQDGSLQEVIAQNLDARQLLDTASDLAQLPDHLHQRLKVPQWSAPVLASAVQQITESKDQQDAAIDFTAFDHLLGQYEQLLDQKELTQVAQQAGEQLVSMDGLALGSFIARRFKGLFGEQLYQQILSQMPDQLLDETIEHLTPRQINRMIVALISDIPLYISKDKDPAHIAADNEMLKRLARTSKGPEITRAVAHNIDAHVLQAPLEQGAALPDQLVKRLQQPAWSAPVLVTAAQQSTDPANFKEGKADFSQFERMLAKYDSLLNKEKQLQVAAQAGGQLADFDEQELGLLLVQKFKNLFGDQLYQQVINQLSDEKFAHLASQLQTLSQNREGLPLDLNDQDIENAYNRLLQTVRGEKMRAVLAMHRSQQEKQQVKVRNNLDQLLQGELKPLAQKEVRRSLPETIGTLFSEGREGDVDSLLMQLAIGLQNQEVPVRSHAAQTLAGVAEKLADTGQWQRLEKLVPALEQAVGTQNMGEEDIGTCLDAVRRLVGHYLDQEQLDRANATIHFIRRLSETTKPEATAPAIRKQALVALNNVATKPVLKHLLEQYLHPEHSREAAGQILAELGTESAKFQLQYLMNSDSRFERKQLLTLIKQTGNPAVSILLEQLDKQSPWFVTRNIIRLLGEIGNSELFPAARPFISHNDPRVQQEVFNTALQIGGEHLQDFLLQALQTVDDSLKGKVVRHMATAHDERFVRPLTDLLEGASSIVGKNKEELQLAICNTLGALRSKRATAPLSRVVQSKTVLGLGGYSDAVRRAADQALDQIRGQAEVKAPAAARLEQTVEASDDEPGHAGGVLPGQGTREQEIFALVAQGNREQAKKELLELIGVTARAGDFETAERLRERIYEIDSLALGEIIRSGEIIEDEKRGAVKEEDLQIWASLTDRLTTEEFLNIYHAFNEQHYKAEEVLVSQGDRNDALFFINQGSIKVSHMAGTRELFITSLSRGQIAGENFFSPSFWTVSLTSLTPSKVYILRQETLKTWEERFPGLRTKLHEFYLASNNISSMLEKKGLERRRDQRFNLSRKIQVQPINNLDAPIGRGFRAETADISLGGLRFLIRISRQDNARLLLGRRMQVVLPVGGKTKYLYLKGLVIGVQPFHVLENDFSVHFKFDQSMDQQGLQTILG